MGIIYCWTNKVTGKKYIGQTIRPEQRMANHKHSALVLGSDFYFHRSLRKRGVEGFDYEVLEETDNLSERETFWIKYHNTVWPNGYNQMETSHVITDEMRKKISVSQKARLAKLTPKQRKIWSQNKSKALKGFKQPDSQKQKVREANQKTWSVTFPDGTVKIINNLRQFCKDNNLGTTGQSNLTRGSYKGYKAHKVTT